MYLIQILLPLYGRSGRAIPGRRFSALSAMLAKRFGGITTYMHSPADGIWKRKGKPLIHDQIVVYEIMSKLLARPWWARKRRELELSFDQESIVIRAHRITTF